jgi:hypothetical protein
MQVCLFDSIQIINLSISLDKETTHRYGSNSFKLHRYTSLSHVYDIPSPGLFLNYIRVCFAIIVGVGAEFCLLEVC